MFKFNFLNFSLLDNEITLKKTGLKIELTSDAGKFIKLIFGVAYTPKTYYSGCKPIVIMEAEMPPNYRLIEKTFGSGVNSQAWVEAISSTNNLIVLPAWGGECKAFQILADYVNENEFCKIFRYGSESINEKFQISFVGQATREEYIQVLNGLELSRFSNLDDIKFAGWKHPNNLILLGSWKIIKNSKYGIFYAKRQDSSKNDDDISSLIEEYLVSLGY